MTAGWVGVIIGGVFTVTILFAVAMGCAAKRGDRQNRRAIERARALKCERDHTFESTMHAGESFAWPGAPTTPGPAYGKMPPFDQESA